MVPQDDSAEERDLDSVDEASLVAALKARSPEAWSALYDRHYRLIYRYILARTDPSSAEDLASTVFLEALKAFPSYSYRGRPVLAWLYRIAHNVASDHQKARRREQGAMEIARSGIRGPLSREAEAPADPLVGFPGALPQGSSDPAADVERIDLRDAVRRLKDSQREVVILHYYLGLTLPRVALLLGKTERAVYSLQARAIEKLRESLTQPG